MYQAKHLKPIIT